MSCLMANDMPVLFCFHCAVYDAFCTALLRSVQPPAVSRPRSLPMSAVYSHSTCLRPGGGIPRRTVGVRKVAVDPIQPAAAGAVVKLRQLSNAAHIFARRIIGKGNPVLLEDVGRGLKGRVSLEDSHLLRFQKGFPSQPVTETVTTISPLSGAVGPF